MKILGIIALLAVLVGAAVGREWSEPIRLTDHRDEDLKYYSMETDTCGNIHLRYKLERAGDRDDISQEIYARYNFRGELLVGPLNPFTDTLGATSASMAVEPNGTAYIIALTNLDTLQEYEYHFLRIGSNGDIEVEPTRLDGLWVHPYGAILSYSDGGRPILRLTHDGSLVFYGRTHHYHDTTYTAVLTYTRISREGEIIDSTRVFYQRTFTDAPPVLYDRFKVDSNGNLYCTWWDNLRQSKLTIISPEDSILVDARTILGEEGHDRIDEMALGDDGSIYLMRRQGMVQGRQEVYCQKLTPDLEVEWYIHPGFINHLQGSTDIVIKDARLAILNNPVESEPLGHRQAYSKITEDGAIIDSLQFLPFEWGSGKDISWLGSDVVAAVTIERLDFRRRWEIWMSTTRLPEAVKKQSIAVNPQDFEVNIYPNPFNNLFKVNYTSPFPKDLQLVMYDVEGRIVLQRTVNTSQSAQTVFAFGSELPSGQYILKVNSIGTGGESKIMGSFKLVKVK